MTDKRMKKNKKKNLSAEEREGLGVSDAVDASENAETLSHAEPLTEESSAQPAAKRGRRIVFGILAGVLVLLLLGVCGFGAAFVAHTARPITVEAGEKPDPMAMYETAFFRSLYDLKSYPEALNIPGEYEAGLRFFGLFDVPLAISVRDTTPPTFTLREVHALVDTPLFPENFVASYKDQTAVSFTFHVPGQEIGEHEIVVVATDAYGNTAEATTRFTLWDRSNRITVDLNTTDVESAMKGLFSEITEVELDKNEAVTEGEYTLSAMSEGALYRWTAYITDRAAPRVGTKNLSVRYGETVAAADFMETLSDASPCTVTFAGTPNFKKVGPQTVRLLVEDSFGNVTAAEASMMICNIPATLSREYGTAAEDVKDELLRDVGATIREDFVLSAIPTEEDGTACLGIHTLTYSHGFASYEITLSVEDTIPPTLKLQDISAFVGDSVTVEDFVLSFEDRDEVTLTADWKVSADMAGSYFVRITAADSTGNTASKTAVLTVAHDTEAPVMWDITNLFIYQGQELSALEALTALDNRDGEVRVTADISAVDVHEPGTYSVHLSAMDEAGNERNETVTVEVLPDTEPPVIHGAKNMSILVGESVSFRKGVSATDAQCGELSVKVDSTGVNTQAEGVYPVVYTCTDPAGNTASVTVYLTVTSLNMDSVNRLADGILGQITTPYMTVYEKAWAIYAWCTANLRYSTRTGYLMGNFVEGAYSGLTTRSGNCYIYYAVASALLTRAGIENIEIQRNDPANPHYWNLVRVNGAWYHFDTCPHYAGHALQCFLLTDAQVWAYSTYEVAGYYSFDATLYPATP